MAPDTEVTIILSDKYPNFSICGLPFYLSGEVSDWKTLAHRTSEDIAKEGIQVAAEHQVISIIPDQKHIYAKDMEGHIKTFSYDKL